MRAKGIKRPMEVETRTLDELKEVLAILDSSPASGITRIMLDNMTRRDAAAPGGLDVSTLDAAMALIGKSSAARLLSSRIVL